MKNPGQTEPRSISPPNYPKHPCFFSKRWLYFVLGVLKLKIPLQTVSNGQYLVFNIHTRGLMYSIGISIEQYEVF